MHVRFHSELPIFSFQFQALEINSQRKTLDLSRFNEMVFQNAREAGTK